MADSAAPPEAAKPIPYPDDVTGGYWAAARDHRLAIQYCATCERFIHLPVLTCPGCDSEDLGYRDVSGRGTLYSYTVMYDVPAPGFADMVPYVCGVVELEEQERLLLLANIIGSSPDAMHVGLPVEVTFEALTADITLPQFRPTGA